MNDDPPLIKLSPETIWCSTHGEPFREAWPSGFVAFSMAVLDFVLVDDPEIARAAGNDSHRLDAVLAEFSPLCCRLPVPTLCLAYLNAGIGGVSRCRRCGNDHWGTSYTWRDQNDVEHREAHMCFACVAQARPMLPPVGR